MENNIEYIVEQYSDMIFRIALAYLGSVSEAEDTVSEVLMTCLTARKKPDIKSGEHFKAWLIKVTVNKCRDIFRSAAFKKKVTGG